MTALPATGGSVTVLAVDDEPANLRLLDAVLTPRGYRVVAVTSGEQALDALTDLDIDLVLLDVLMPGLDGHEVCRRIRARDDTAFLPVVMITASGPEQRLTALEAGADDFVTKPFDRSELLARVASLARLKRYHDTIERQARELVAWNAELEQRVTAGVAELERTNRLRHFLGPQLAEVVLGDAALLDSHRREIVVVFFDFHGFTTFAETSEPEEVMEVLRDYHQVVGTHVQARGGTLERFTGDGVMVFFNDPVTCDDPADRAVGLALDVDRDVRPLAEQWRRAGHHLTHRAGISMGYATLGRIGFPGRFDYAAIGSVTNLAARLCADAGDWEVRISDRVLAALGDRAEGELVGDVQLRGFSRPVRVHTVTSLRVGTGDAVTTVERVPGPRTLTELTEEERFAAYDDLQRRMPHIWDGIRRDLGDESVVVVPSISTQTSGTLTQAMEERSLFLLLLLRQPRLRMIYVTSNPVSEAVVEYYLGLLPGVIPRHARFRLTMVALNDATPGSLSAKLLARPRVLRDIRRRIPNRASCHLVPYNATALERDVALTLGIPMYAADPRLLALGTKTGCRRIFEELGIECPAGAEDLRTLDDLVGGLQDMRRRRPRMAEAIVKLNDGVSGHGNAVVDLRDLPEPGSPEEPDLLRERLLAMALEDPTIGVNAYLDSFDAGGGIVEERIIGHRLTSPSVQMRALPDGTVELLSTHDQLLGGASGQTYLGCIFPADPAYAALIARPAMVVGRHLASLGVLGRFAVDFVTVQDDAGSWSAYAIELNLRKGGTTHPFLTLQFVTDGTYDGESGLYRTPAGQPKYLVATDHLEDPRLTALTVDDVFDIVARRRLHFDASRQTGAVLHMISCVTECGRLGLTAVGDSAAQAWELYEQAQRVVLEEAEFAREDGAVFL